jgi:two-component system sensor histidine kinase UhpB
LSGFSLAKRVGAWWGEARQNGLRTIVLACFVFLLCYLTSELGGLLEVHVPQTLWLLWPGCAILAGVMLLEPWQVWPMLVVAGLAGFVVYDLQAGLTAASIFWLMLVDLAEILAATLGIRAVFDREPRLNNVKSLIKYSVFAVILAPAVTATLGAQTSEGNYWISWRIIFLSEALAFLTLPPAMLSWAAQLGTWRQKPARYWIEVGTLISGVAPLGYVISVTSHRVITPGLSFALVPFLIWAALRFGSLGVSSSIILVAFLSISGAIHGRGPFIGSTPLANVLSLQLFLLSAAIPFMVLAVLAEEHAQAKGALQELSGRLITAQEQERTRLARELHDDLSQRMARLLMRMERCRQGMVDMPAKSQLQFEEISEMASELSASLRDLSHVLHPATLATLGLETSIAGFCREFSEQHHVDVKFVCRDIPKDPSEDVSLCVFRVVQEALRNVARHSAAREARVTLTGDGDKMQLFIEDSGIGFDLKMTDGKETLGLVSMRERVRLVGGQFSIHSEPGSGTRIWLQVPVKRIPIEQIVDT